MSGDDAAAQWLKDAMRFGMSCSVVEGKRSLGRNGTFEDTCIKTRLRLTRGQLEVESGGISVQWKELKNVEAHHTRPSSPVFRTAHDDVFGRLATLRWNQTGRQLQTGQYVHLVFPTRADARAFRTGVSEVQRYGVSAVLAGRGGREDATAEPTSWQIERGREFFARTLKSWRGRRLGSAAAEALAAAGACCILADLGHEEEEVPGAQGPEIAEDAEMHIRWHDALAGRAVLELSQEELRPLVDTGIPLKYRHALWPQWPTARPREEVGARGDSCPIEDLQSKVPHSVAKQVELDIPRTMPAWLDIEGRSILRRVLNAYAAREPRTGYCQGMNFLAMVFIVLGFSEAVVFAGLCHLVEDVCPGYHSLGLEGYLRDTAVLGVLVHRRLPAVHQLLEASDVPLNVLALDHFVTLASRVWPLAATVRLWDLVLLEGSPAVFASFLATLELYMPGAAGRAGAGAPSGESGASGASSADVMLQFRIGVQRGASEELETLLEHTRRWILQVPLSQIEWLRAEILGEDDS